MSASRTSALLVALYPPEWRERYGEELEDLIAAASSHDRVPWRVRADVALGAARERLRAAGFRGAGGPAERVRGGAVLVLCAWALFVVAGVGVQKLSEHWQNAASAGTRALPTAAFDVLVIAAACTGLLVVTAIGLTAPQLAAFLRGGGWSAIRRRVSVAAVVTGVAVAATIALIVWAHGLTARQREGHEVGYAVAFVGWALVCAGCLASWTAVAVATARRLQLPVATLRAQAWIACAVTVLMGLMTAATVVWWAALAQRAPWFLAGQAPGSSAGPIAPELLVAALVMLLATGLGAAGAWRAVAAVPALSVNRTTRESSRLR